MAQARPSRSLIAASILDSDLGTLAEEVRRAEAAGADRIHMDIMDGHFVPNLTFGWRTVAALRRVTELPFDAHLMMDEPGRWIEQFLDAGCNSITLHLEVDAAQIRPSLERIREAGRTAGLCLRPGTPLNGLAPYRDLLDIVMVMTVEPGFGGQAFREDVASAKLWPARGWLDAGGANEVHLDGGAHRDTAASIGRGGTDVIVVGSALYRADDMAVELERIRALADGARATTLGA